MKSNKFKVDPELKKGDLITIKEPFLALYLRDLDLKNIKVGLEVKQGDVCLIVDSTKNGVCLLTPQAWVGWIDRLDVRLLYKKV
jgi:hypothetical protein